MKYGIGLDCGIASVGYSVMELNEHDEPCRIVRLGSRIFDQAENPKDGSSLALPRREARGARRRTRRHQHRLDRIKYLLVSENVLTANVLETLFDGQLSDIYQLRTDALDRPVSNTEFARILIHLAQRRGFKSNRKVDASDKEDGKLLTAVSENQKRMAEKGYRTVGEMFCKDERFARYKRNKGEDYVNTVSRAMVEDEIKAIFAAQRSFGVPFAAESFESKYTDIVLSQRPFDEGPGKGNANSPSPYAGNQIEKMIGKCTLLPEEKRAAKAAYSFQYFTLLQNINHLKLVDGNGEKRALTAEEKRALKEACFKKATVNFHSIRKTLGLPDDVRFVNLSYGNNATEDVEKKAKFEFLSAYHKIKKALGETVNTLSVDELDAIGYVFTAFKNDDRIKEELAKRNINPSLFDALLTLPSFSKFGHISTKACKMIIPHLEQGLVYSDACAAAGIDFKGHSAGDKQVLLPATGVELEDIVNPVVKRAVSQTIKVINAIIREMKTSPAYINIELARDLSKSKKERDDIEKQYQKNRAANEKIIEELKNNFHIQYPSGQDIVKLKLWHEQGEGICVYSLQQIEYARLFEDGYVDIDHIIPYSISFDDSYSNKVLTLARENRMKGNKIPMQYLPESKKSDYQVWVNANIRNYRKRQNLLKTKLTDEDLAGFKTRNLNDTRYLSRVLFNFINDHLQFDEYKQRKQHVQAVNGAATAYMRKRWGIAKIREDGDLHHAVDATVIACVTKTMIDRIAQYAQFREIGYAEATDEGSHVVNLMTGEVFDTFPVPYPKFRKELEIRTEVEDLEQLHTLLRGLPNYSAEEADATQPCFVSRMPRRKATGAAHQETVRSGREPGYTVSKVPLSALKFDKDGEIANYYKPESDLLLYNALKQRLAAFGGNGEAAFPQGFEFHKPRANGEEGPIVKKVKIREKATLSVPVRDDNGVAANGSMVRIDVFFVEGDGYYFVPIYVSDTVKQELPSKACVAFKPHEEWKDMDESNFIFSLYPNDLIRITSTRGIKFSTNLKDSSLPKEKHCNETLVYFKMAGISTAAINVTTNDNAYVQPSLGIKTLKSIEKYTVDPIGNLTKVGKETRMRFH